MLNEYQTRINLGIGIGVLLSLPALLLVLLQKAPTIVFLLLLVSIAFFCWGCSGYARAKGYHWLLGLLAIIPPVGLLVLLLLPDRRPMSARTPESSAADSSGPATAPRSTEPSQGT